MALGNGGNPTATAEFDSECPGCFEQIDAGDTITLTGEGWVCPDCGNPDDHASTRRRPGAQPSAHTDIEAMGY